MHSFLETRVVLFGQVTVVSVQDGKKDKVRCRGTRAGQGVYVYGSDEMCIAEGGQGGLLRAEVIVVLYAKVVTHTVAEEEERQERQERQEGQERQEKQEGGIIGTRAFADWVESHF